MPKRPGRPPSVAATGQRLAASLLVTVLMLGCSGPAHRPALPPGAATDQRSPILLGEPRLSPDGTAILFAFKYGTLPYKLAVIPADPAESRIGILQAPPTMSWTQPAWAPDQRNFAAISYCKGDNCYEGAKGYHVWRFAVRPGPDNLRRITFDDGEVRRADPFFGRSADDLHWVLSSSRVHERVRWDLNERFLVRARGDQAEVLFPDDPEVLPIRRPDAQAPNSAPRIRSKKFALSDLSPAHAFDGTTLYFTGRVRDGTLPLARAIMDTKNRYERMLFRWRGGDALELLRDTPVIAVDAQRSGSGYVVASRTPNFANRPVDFDVVSDGGTERRLSFGQGNVFAMSASERMDTIAFASFRHLGDEVRFWVHQKGMAQAADLNVAERVSREVERQIQREANEGAAGQGAPRATPAPRQPAAAPR
ncbi:hypothetical protein GCM10009416_00810 [Craurococcus roseus]|uniref:Lipoprotein n=1 Tax=Craurococcus roseus TaxID=77585 RepID=A0ABN1EJ31_9PROT